MITVYILLAIIAGSLDSPAKALVQSGVSPHSLVPANMRSSCLPPYLPGKKHASFPHTYKNSANSLPSQTTEYSPSILNPSIFFLALSAILGILLWKIQQSSLPATLGTQSLFFVACTVAYDDFILGLGANVFGDAKTDEKVHRIFEWLSYPRFLFHFMGVPLLYSTVAEIGNAAGVKWLQSDIIQNFIALVAAVVAILSSVRFVQGPGIQLADTSKSPRLVRQLLWFTYKKQDFMYYVFPAIVLALGSILVGMMATFGGNAAGMWLIASGVGVLAGSAQKPHVARFTGNLSEVTMLWCMFMTATLAV